MSVLEVVLGAVVGAVVGGVLAFFRLKYELAKKEDEKHRYDIYIPLYKEVQENLNLLKTSLKPLSTTFWEQLNNGLTICIEEKLRKKLQKFYEQSNKYNKYIADVGQAYLHQLGDRYDEKREEDSRLGIMRKELILLLTELEETLKKKTIPSNRFTLFNVLDKHNWVVLIVVTAIIAILAAQLSSQQNELISVQNNISLKQAEINEKLFNLTKSKEPHPVLFVETSSDYGLGFADNQIAAFRSISKTFSAYENETLIVTLVNPGSGPLNIKGVWGMFMCTNQGKNKTVNGFPEICGQDSRNVIIDDKPVARVVDNIVLMPNEKISQKVIIRPPKIFNNQLNNYTGIDQYGCILYLDIFASSENNEFIEIKKDIPFQWINLSAEELSKTYPWYQPSIHLRC